MWVFLAALGVLAYFSSVSRPSYNLDLVSNTIKVDFNLPYRIKGHLLLTGLVKAQPCDLPGLGSLSV